MYELEENKIMTLKPAFSCSERTSFNVIYQELGLTTSFRLSKLNFVIDIQILKPDIIQLFWDNILARLKNMNPGISELII